MRGLFVILLGRKGLYKVVHYYHRKRYELGFVLISCHLWVMFQMIFPS